MISCKFPILCQRDAFLMVRYIWYICVVFNVFCFVRDEMKTVATAERRVNIDAQATTPEIVAAFS